RGARAARRAAHTRRAGGRERRRLQHECAVRRLQAIGPRPRGRRIRPGGVSRVQVAPAEGMKVLELLSLKGRNALVTGGSRGLGMQMAEALGEMGARVAITARKQDELGEAVSRLSKQGISATAYVCDMGRREAILPAVEQILRDFGKIDILVNNAGATWGAPAEDHPLEGWDKLIVRTLAYNTTKGGLVNFTRALAAEWGEHGITVNAICPGFFPSKMTRATLDTAGELIRDWTPTKRLGNDEDLK